jgi:hypothetical protein
MQRCSAILVANVDKFFVSVRAPLYSTRVFLEYGIMKGSEINPTIFIKVALQLCRWLAI